VLFTEALKEIPLQVASAVFFSLTIVGLFLVAYFFFDEAITMYRLVGAAFITVGVIIISWK
jgi:multidrug transporter EmrE-like cation transporter